MTYEELKENFDFLPDWEDKYAYIIELGKSLPPMDEADKNDETKVDGCMSQVWLKTDFHDGILTFVADSDAFIVKGLIAVLQTILSGKTPEQIAGADVDAAFAGLGLDTHLSPTRRNGFFSMVAKVKARAAALSSR